MDSHDHALEIAGDHSEWWGFEPPEQIPEREDEIWWCKRVSLENLGFIDKANNMAWADIGHKAHVDCISNSKPQEVLFSSGCMWVKIFTDVKKEEMTVAGKEVVDALCALADYACLDDTVASQLKYDAQLESIQDHWPENLDEDVAPEDDHQRATQIWRWLWDNSQHDLEDEDGYVSVVHVEKACWNLGWLVPVDGNDFVSMMTRFKKKGGAREGNPE
jgi:hypothetical protein